MRISWPTAWSNSYGPASDDERKRALTSESRQRDIPILLWPFYAIWRLLTLILEMAGRLVCAVLGLALMVAGAAISITVVAAPIGIPLAVFGFLLAVRALF